MESSLFRQKSIDKVKSPDQLNNYLKVPNPSTWLLLAAILIMLIGFVVWGFVGNLETKIETYGKIENNTLTVFVKETEIDNLKVGNVLEVGNLELKITEIPQNTTKLTDELTEAELHQFGFEKGEFVYIFEFKDTNLEDGMKRVKIITEKIHPLDFVFN